MPDLPSAIQSEVDRWLVSQGEAPKNWIVEPINDRGLSVAKVWRLRLLNKQPSGKMGSETQQSLIQRAYPWGFAIRDWGLSIQHRDRIKQILAFQRSLHFGFADRGNSALWNNEPIQVANIIPTVLDWNINEVSIECKGTIWTLASWCHGHPIADGELANDHQLDDAIQVLVSLHKMAQRLGTYRMVPPGMIDRARRLENLIVTPHRRALMVQSMASINELAKHQPTSDHILLLTEIAHRFESHCDRHAKTLSLRLQGPLDRSVDCCWTIRDLWRENVLVQDSKVTGIIDFGAARIDWPVLEVVRWLSSWLPANDSRIETLLQEYNDATQQLTSNYDFHFLDHVATLLSIYQWLEWLPSMETSFYENKAALRLEDLDKRLMSFD